MRKDVLAGMAMFLLLVLLATGCAPKAAPAPAPAPAPAQGVAAPQPAPKAPAVESEWDKVVKAARAEGKLFIYSSKSRQEWDKALRPFEEKYGVKVDVVAGRGAESRVKIQVEQRTGQPVADISEGGPTSHYELMVKAGFSSSAKDLPIFQEKTTWRANPVYDPDGYIIMYGVLPSIVPAVNTKLVKPEEEPHTWKDLLDPKWKGKMVMDDLTITGAANVWFAGMLRGKVVDMDYMEKLGRQNVAFNRSYQQIFDALARGEFAIAPVSSTYHAVPYIQAGAPIKFVDFQDGTATSPITMGLVKTPAHPNAARVFINWALSQDGQKAMLAGPNIWPNRTDFTWTAHPAIQKLEKIKVYVASLEDSFYAADLIKDKVPERLFRPK